jgi:hypothetical protein
MSQISTAETVPGAVDVEGAASAFPEITLEQMKLVHDLLISKLHMAGKYQKQEFQVSSLVPVTGEGFYFMCTSSSQSFTMQVYRARSTILIHITQTLLAGGNVEEHNGRSNDVTLMVCATWSPESMQHDALNIHLDNIVEAAVIGPRSDDCRALFLARTQVELDGDKFIADVELTLPESQTVFNTFFRLKWPKPQLLRILQWDGGFVLAMKSRKHFSWRATPEPTPLLLVTTLRENGTAVLNFCGRTWLYLPQRLLLAEAVVTEIRDMLLMEH